MAIPKRSFFSIGGAVCYDITTKLPLGKVDIASASSLELTGELVPLKGGPNQYDWGVAKGYIESKITLNCKEKPTFLYRLALGVDAVTEAQAEGAIKNIANIEGTALQGDDVITGVTILDKDDLKFGRYVIRAVSATTFDVYLSTNIDQRRGMPLTFADNNLLKINSDPYTLAADTNVEIASAGLSLTLAASADFDTAGVTAGDAFEFFVVPPTAEFNEILVSNRTEDVTFGMYLYTESQDNGRAMMIDVFNCKMLGMTHAFAEKAWDETELNVMPYINEDGNLCRIYDIAS